MSEEITEAMDECIDDLYAICPPFLRDECSVQKLQCLPSALFPLQSGSGDHVPTHISWKSLHYIIIGATYYINLLDGHRTSHPSYRITGTRKPTRVVSSPRLVMFEVLPLILL